MILNLYNGFSLFVPFLPMYLFSFCYGSWFWKYYRVFSTPENIWSSGDLIKIWDDYVLLLWDTISFPEKYDHVYPFLWSQGSPKQEVLIPTFFDDHFLALCHWMVQEWFSDYRSVMKYFVPLEIDDLLKRRPTGKMHKNIEQNLYIFPDNWTRYNFLGEYYKESKEHLQLFSTDTEKKKNEHRRSIKYGIAKHIFATQSEIFQPYQCLKKIYFVDSYKWYYHNQQDPRYSLKTVVEKLRELYQCEVITLDFKAHF